MISFRKYHGLGNDYLVIDPKDISEKLTPTQIRTICHRNYGIGSDGLLLGPIHSNKNPNGLRIFNPDGSEAEKSGNGLRIFARYLWDLKLVDESPFTILTLGGQVSACVHPDGKMVDVDMGQVSFHSRDIPMEGPAREVLSESMLIENQKVTFSAATIGNPHCVLLLDKISESLAKKWGPIIENDQRFPNRTNVQFVQVRDRHNIQIEIWERGAGYTLASGSSSCAAAAVAHKLGFCDSEITVHMIGGSLKVEIKDQYEISMSGPVCFIAEGTISDEVFKAEQ